MYTKKTRPKILNGLSGALVVLLILMVNSNFAVNQRFMSVRLCRTGHATSTRLRNLNQSIANIIIIAKVINKIRKASTNTENASLTLDSNTSRLLERKMNSWLRTSSELSNANLDRKEAIVMLAAIDTHSHTAIPVDNSNLPI